MAGPPPTPGPGPLPACRGKAGDPGWTILNNTGGGGPGFAHFSAKGLSPTDLEACRSRCCASPLCASVVLHEIKEGEFGCWLNPKDGTKAPYARPQTILAYVNRTAAAAH